MTSDRLDRIDLLVYRLNQLAHYWEGDSEFAELIDLVSQELRYLHNRPLTEQEIDSKLSLKEQN